MRCSVVRCTYTLYSDFLYGVQQISKKKQEFWEDLEKARDRS